MTYAELQKLEKKVNSLNNKDYLTNDFNELHKLYKLEAWEITKALTEKEIPENMISVEVDPSAIKVGDLLSSNGFIAEVIAIRISTEDNEPDCYCIDTVYKYGNLSTAKFLIRAAISGTVACSGFTYLQGNNRADWFKVI